MTDRSVAGSAGLRNGSNVEMMQERRLITHDNYGVSEMLNDSESINGRYYLQISEARSNQRELQRRLEMPVVMV